MAKLNYLLVIFCAISLSTLSFGSERRKYEENLGKLKTYFPDGKYLGKNNATGRPCTLEIHSTSDSLQITAAELDYVLHFPVSLNNDFSCEFKNTASTCWSSDPQVNYRLTFSTDSIGNGVVSCFIDETRKGNWDLTTCTAPRK